MKPYYLVQSSVSSINKYFAAFQRILIKESDAGCTQAQFKDSDLMNISIITPKTAEDTINDL